MSVIIKSTEMSYKDPNSGDYVGINVLAEKKTSDLLNEIEAKGQTIISDIPASYDDLNNIVADSYDSTKTYSVGDYVRYYNGTHDKLYRCVTDISTAEAWTSGHWTEVVMAGEVSDLNSAITKLKIMPINIIDDSKYKYNTFYGNTIGTSTINDIRTTTSGNCTYGVYPCNNGDVIKFSGRTASTYYLYDANGILRLYSTSGGSTQITCAVDGYTIGYWAIVDRVESGVIKAWCIPSELSEWGTLYGNLAGEGGTYQQLEIIDIIEQLTAVHCLPYVIDSNNYSEQLSDLDTASINKVYNINSCLQSISNIPQTGATSGTFICLNGDCARETQTNKSFTVQIFIDTGQNWYFRSCWGGTFGNWKLLQTPSTIKSEIDNHIYNNANFSLVEKFGVIGDSLAVGSYRQRNGTDTSSLSKSWAHYIEQECSNEAFYFAFGGATTTSWIENVSKGLSAALNPSNECNAYLIGLGYNDANPNSSSGGVTLGSIADIDPDDPDDNAVSFYGNLDKILRKLHTAYPYAPLFVFTNPYYNTTYVPDYNTAVRAVCSNLGTESNVHLIDLYTLYSDLLTSLIADREGNHYHPQTYAYFGRIIMTAISNYMLNHAALFKYVGE